MIKNKKFNYLAARVSDGIASHSGNNVHTDMMVEIFRNANDAGITLSEANFYSQIVSIRGEDFIEVWVYFPNELDEAQYILEHGQSLDIQKT